MLRARNVQQPSETTKAIISGEHPLAYATVGEVELERYKQLSQFGNESAKLQHEDREHRHKLSQDRVKHWPNTIEALRVKKERLRQEKLEQEEKRRQLIDQEEAELQAAKKAQAIRKANLMLFQENDRVKTFTSKLFLASVLEEREKQLAIRDEKKAYVVEAEKQWALTEAEQLRKAREEDVEKIKQIRQREVDIKKAQLSQLDDIRQIKIKQRDDDRAEGQRIKREAIEAVDEERQLEAERLHEQKAIAAQLVQANENLKSIRVQNREAEAQEDQKIEAFAAAKEQQMLLRKKRVEEKFHAKLERRQKIIDRQAQLLCEIQAAQEERELRQLRDFDRERAEREAAEEAYRRRRQQEIEDFSKAHLARKQKQRDKELLEKQRMTEIWRTRADVLIDEELDERRHARESAERNQKFLLLQAQEKRMQTAKERAAEMEEGIAMQKAMKDEQEIFHSYVNSVMNEYVRNGRSAAQLRNTMNPRLTTELKSA